MRHLIDRARGMKTQGTEKMTIQELERTIALHGKELYSFCLYLTENADMADELYQETWLATLRRMDEIDAGGNLKSWLLSVAIRLWKNRKRKFAWRKRIAPTEPAFPETAKTWESPSEDGLSHCLASEKKDEVKKAVQTLSEKYRIPLALYYMEEMSVAEIAQTLAIPQGTVKSRLSAAREKLRRELEGYFYG